MIENYGRLASSHLRKQALDILVTGVTRVLPKTFMPGNIASDGEILDVCGDIYDLRRGNLYVIGGGKAAGAMAEELEKIVAPRAGIVIDKSTGFETAQIRIRRGGHPMPSREGQAGMQRMLKLTSALTEHDTVICLISGGGSSLMYCPVDGIQLSDMQELTRLVLRAGLTVSEINVLRKRLSRVAGGKLARHLHPATVIGLILSDTINSEADTASGPTAVDPGGYAEAYEILERYGLLTAAPTRIVEHIRQGLRGEITVATENPGPSEARVHNYVLADNAIALSTMHDKAAEAGFDTALDPDPLAGEARDTAARIARRYRLLAKQGGISALLAGGETTVTVKGNGKGGRNQEFVAALIPEIKDLRQVVCASLASDGADFLDGVGGAIITESAFDECQTIGIQPEQYLRHNNTYELHKRLGSLIEMKPTHTNVADIAVFLCHADNRG